MKRKYRGNELMISKVLAFGAAVQRVSRIQPATQSDAEKLAAAEAKRERRARKRAAP
jgi:hypothetical protein